MRNGWSAATAEVEQLTLATAGQYQFFGGGAGDDAQFRRTQVFYGTKAFSEAFEQHARRTGQSFDAAAPLPFFLHNILGIETGAGFRLRVPLAITQDGAVTCASEIPAGATVHVMRTTASSAIEAATRATKTAVASLGGHPAQVAFFFDCLATRLRMGDVFGVELESLARGLGEAKFVGCLVRRLIALHGGSIEAKSEGVGKGSEFIVRLPITDQRLQGVQATARRHAQTRGACWVKSTGPADTEPASTRTWSNRSSWTACWRCWIRCARARARIDRAVRRLLSSLSSRRRERQMERRATLHRWESMPREQLNERIGRRMITGDRMMLAHIYLKKGAVVPRHQHENEQITYVLEGALRFRLGADGAQQVDVRSGEVLTIPPNLPHAAEALEDTLDVDIFDPPRQDWLDGNDAYLRGK